MNIKVNKQHVFIKTKKVKGMPKEDSPKEKKAKVTYYKNEKRYTEWFDYKDLAYWKPPLTIKVKYFNKEIDKIEKISIGDWIDLRVAEEVNMKEGEFKLISLGVGMKLPKGYEANVVPRSSTFYKYGIIQANSIGVIDNSYSGNEDEWKFPAYATRDIKIDKNTRICQFRIQRIMPKVRFEEVENLDEISRGGLGKTGSK